MIWIKKILITILVRGINRKKLQIDKSAFADLHSFFEGMNSVGPHTHIVGSYFGYATYVANNTKISRAKIGRFSCIGPNVNIISGQHPISFASLHPAFYSREKMFQFSYVKENKFTHYRYADPPYHVQIGNDVWIGDGAGIMEGVTIGDGAIVAAGAIVTKDVKPYTIVGGIPATKIRDRFEKNIVEKLLQLSWWNKDLLWIQEHAELFDNVETLFNQLELEGGNQCSDNVTVS